MDYRNRFLVYWGILTTIIVSHLWRWLWMSHSRYIESRAECGILNEILGAVSEGVENVEGDGVHSFQDVVVDERSTNV